MAPVNQELVDLFIARAEAVAAQVQRLPNMAAALQYAVDVCARKAPCELLADEDVEKGPDGPNKVPTRVQKILAAPDLPDADFAQVMKKAADLRSQYTVTVLPQAKKLGKQFGQLEAQGFAAAAFADNDDIKALGAAR